MSLPTLSSLIVAPRVNNVPCDGQHNYWIQWTYDGCSTTVCVADVDDGTGTGTPDGGLTIDDLPYYLFRFEAGC